MQKDAGSVPFQMFCCGLTETTCITSKCMSVCLYATTHSRDLDPHHYGLWLDRTIPLPLVVSNNALINCL